VMCAVEDVAVSDSSSGIVTHRPPSVWLQGDRLNRTTDDGVLNRFEHSLGQVDLHYDRLVILSKLEDSRRGD
jgi:hypothetical protein